jgi:hypothetical protein
MVGGLDEEGRDHPADRQTGRPPFAQMPGVDPTHPAPQLMTRPPSNGTHARGAGARRQCLPHPRRKDGGARYRTARFVLVAPLRDADRNRATRAVVVVAVAA